MTENVRNRQLFPNKLFTFRGQFQPFSNRILQILLQKPNGLAFSLCVLRHQNDSQSSQVAQKRGC